MDSTIRPRGLAEVTQESWGVTSDGSPVALFTLRSDVLTVKVSDYGARIVAVLVRDEDGAETNVCLGYDSLAGYEKDTTYMGAIVGRFGNRIALAKFTLDGQQYELPANDPPNSLHGGYVGFDRKVWAAASVHCGVEFTLLSPDGDMGYPGTLTVKTRYVLSGNELHIDFTATTDRATIVNVTNHAYFNLAGEASGTILDQQLSIDADFFTPVDSTAIPTGEIAPVKGTPFDFQTPTPIGKRIHSSNEQLKFCRGYDHNYVLNGSGLREAAQVIDPASGRRLSVLTTEPGVQFYSGNYLDGQFTGVGGKAYEQRTGFCLEMQHFPDAPNQVAFPSTRLDPGDTMKSTTVLRFDVLKLT